MSEKNKQRKGDPMSKKDIVIVDTETTNLTRCCASDIAFQPYIIEVYAYRVDYQFNKIGEFHSLVNPPVSIPNFITRITGINDIRVRNAPKFKKILKPLTKIMKGAGTFVAHNATFDRDMIDYEGKRAGVDIAFPKDLFCTVEQSMHFFGYRLKALELFTHLTGKKEIPNQHRAKADVMATFENYKILRGLI